MTGDSPARTGIDNPQWAPCACGELAYHCRCALPPVGDGPPLLVRVWLARDGGYAGFRMAPGVVRPDLAPRLRGWLRADGWYGRPGETTIYDRDGGLYGRVVSWQRVEASDERARLR